MKWFSRLRARWSEPIIVVSGLPRSGTSMMMKMLEAGGVRVFVDHVRPADEDNPKGYYEYEPVKSLREMRDLSWLYAARGSALKVISYLLPSLPPDHRYRVVFMNRNLDEVLASQNKMLERRGETLEQSPDILKEAFGDQLWRARAWWRQRKAVQVLELEYADVLAEPMAVARRLESFLGRPLDLPRMAQVVDLRLYRNRFAGERGDSEPRDS